MTRPLTLGGIATAAIAVTLLAGCTPSSASSAPTTGATPAPTATTPTPGPVAETSPDPAATCDTVLTEAEYAKLAADGLVLNEGDIWILGPAMEDLAADGALTCEWHGGGGGDISVWYAQLAEDDAAWESRRAGLEASGWTVSDDPVAETLLAPPDYDANYQPSMLHAEGVTHFTSYAAFLQSVAALQ
jgi:hypothetical protein